MKDISLRGKGQREHQGLCWPGLQGSAQEVMCRESQCERGRPVLPPHLVHSSTLKRPSPLTSPWGRKSLFVTPVDRSSSKGVPEVQGEKY